MDYDNCTVLFDLLLKNGNRDDRFYTINYCNNTFDFNSLTHITDIPNDIRKHCCEYYYTNQYLFENTILPLPLVFLIKKGQII
ncbi:type II toxin-antitoxin system RnlB family antitoxin [Vallitalea longa]|uniref:type II toxin-antitoxin system RnlB family antitoxin n=1 Tax=Vallitalea longa TaxID=2936439 RepID=UPI003365B061